MNEKFTDTYLRVSSDIQTMSEEYFKLKSENDHLKKTNNELRDFISRLQIDIAFLTK
jgi:cell division protein FtsB